MQARSKAYYFDVLYPFQDRALQIITRLSTGSRHRQLSSTWRTCVAWVRASSCSDAATTRGGAGLIQVAWLTSPQKAALRIRGDSSKWRIPIPCP